MSSSQFRKSTNVAASFKTHGYFFVYIWWFYCNMCIDCKSSTIKVHDDGNYIRLLIIIFLILFFLNNIGSNIFLFLIFWSLFLIPSCHVLNIIRKFIIVLNGSIDTTNSSSNLINILFSGFFLSSFLVGSYYDYVKKLF